MTSLGNGISDDRPGPVDVRERFDAYEEHINLLDYLVILWRHKWLVVFGSVLPALIVGLILFLSPREYKVTFVYDVKDRSSSSTYYRNPGDEEQQELYDNEDQSICDISNWNLNEKNYNVLLDRFYSAENTEKIVSKLRQSSPDTYAEKIRGIGGVQDLKKFVDFEVMPPYVDLAEITEPAKLERIHQLKAQLLSMTITAGPKNDIPRICAVIRDNFEKVFPVYLAQEQLSTTVREYKSRIADIEANKFNLQLALKTDKAVLARLKNIDIGNSSQNRENVALQFDVGDKSEYLPLSYQIQAAESKVAVLEENLRENEEKNHYYKDLLTLKEKLLTELGKQVSSYYTIEQFKSFLAGLVPDCKNEQLKDYLNSYIRRIENRISATVPVAKRPTIYVVPKKTVKKAAIIFALSLIIAVLVAFLRHGIEKNKVRTL